MTETTYTEPIDPGQPIAPVTGVEQDFTTGFDDYWGTDETKRIVLPDGKQSVIIQLMTEGQRAQFERTQNQDLRVDREQTTTIKIDPGRTRKALLKAAIVNWEVKRRTASGEWQDVKFSDANLNAFIDGANPRIIDKIEKEIREYNIWLKNDLTVEEIEKEIASLERELEAAKVRAAGE